jgi:DNA-binding transcriptional LysR family regulator
MRSEKGLTMDKLSAMKAFVRVVEAGTFTKAADSLGVPKAQMTRLVQSLEEDLKTLLLNRTTRRVTVTADGAAYYDRAVRVLDEIEELESSLTHAKVNPRGKLRIDAPASIANFVLIPAMEDFCTRYPDIQIDIGASDRPIDLIGDNVDCVLRAGKVTDQSLVARRISDIRPVVCASPAYLERFGVPQHPSDLEDDRHRVVAFFFRGGEPLPYVLYRGDERYEVNTKSTIAVNENSAMLAAGLAGLGIARIGPVLAAPHLAAGTLQVVLPEWSAEVWPLYVVYPPNRHVSAKVRVFIDWVIDLFGRVPYGPARPQAAAGQRGVPDSIAAQGR